MHFTGIFAIILVTKVLIVEIKITSPNPSFEKEGDKTYDIS